MQVSAPLTAAVLSGGGLKAMVTKSANWGKRLCQTHRQRKQLQGELCDSLTLLPNTPKPCEDKPSRSVKLLLRLLGTLKKSHFVLLKFPDSQVTARGESARQKLLPGVLGQRWGHSKSGGKWGAPTWEAGKLQSCSHGCCGLELRFSSRKSFDAPKNPWHGTQRHFREGNALVVCLPLK